MGQFVCDECGGTFDLGDDEEARAEAIANGFLRRDGTWVEPCGITCDECHEKIMKIVRAERSRQSGESVQHAQ